MNAAVCRTRTFRPSGDGPPFPTGAFSCEQPCCLTHHQYAAPISCCRLGRAVVDQGELPRTATPRGLSRPGETPSFVPYGEPMDTR